MQGGKRPEIPSNTAADVVEVIRSGWKDNPLFWTAILAQVKALRLTHNCVLTGVRLPFDTKPEICCSIHIDVAF